MQREQWGSKIGFILAAAGSAVGLGNIWKFPYLTGTNGGAAFVFIYILMVAAIGFTVMLAELVIGRAGQQNAVGSFKKLGGKGWSLVGWLGLACGFVILSYYAVIGGWTIKYFFHSFTGLMGHAGSGGAESVFNGFVSNTIGVVFFQALFMAMTIYIVFRGIGGGIEKYCKFMMPTLFLLLIILIFRSVTLPGASKGLEFYLSPKFSEVTGKTILAALGQAFFSLSLGMGCMITYGSYLKRDVDLPKSTVQICVLDTAVALLAGLVIFPAVFAFNVDPGAGPGLTFVTLPGVFAQMPLGMFWSAAFFLLLFMAALTSAISLLEVVSAYLVDKGYSRKFASISMGTAIFILGIPSAISLSGIELTKIGGKDFLDAAGVLTDNIMMPIGGILICIFAGWIIPKVSKDEVTNEGKNNFGVYKLWLIFVRYVAPIAILIIFISGMMDLLK